MSYQIRTARFPEDAAAIASLITSVQAEPITAEQVAEGETKNRNAIRRVVVAEAAEGTVAAYGSTTHWEGAKPGMFFTRIITDRARRGTGAGSAVLAALEQFARENGGTLLRASVKDNDERSRAFALNRGFTVTRHIFDSVLDVATFDDARFAGAVEGVEAGGIRFFTFDTVESMESKRRLYDLCQTALRDNPTTDRDEPPEPFDRWHWVVFERGVWPLDCMVIAADGDRFVGATLMEVRKTSGNCYNAATMVDREYRGRHIALALKLLTIPIARRYGAAVIRTENDSENGPMLAVNRKLGYVPEPGDYYVERVLD